LNWSRDGGSTAASVIKSVVLGVVVMAIFFQLPETDDGIRSRYGLMYSLIGIGNYVELIVAVDRLCRELRIFDREQEDSMYSPSSYLVGSMFATLPWIMIETLIYGITVYFGCGLRPGYCHVLHFLALVFTCSLTINGVAWLSVSLHRSFTIASLIGNMQYTFIT
jgi:hypothetical protein